jgi:hypothetical protein
VKGLGVKKRAYDPSEPARIRQALIGSGYKALDAQAKALGLGRSTTWVIVASQHKMGRISQKVRARMLTHPDLPASVRAVLEAGVSTEISGQENSVFPKASGERSHFVLTRPKTCA